MATLSPSVRMTGPRAEQVLVRTRRVSSAVHWRLFLPSRWGPERCEMGLEGAEIGPPGKSLDFLRACQLNGLRPAGRGGGPTMTTLRVSRLNPEFSLHPLQRTAESLTHPPRACNRTGLVLDRFRVPHRGDLTPKRAPKKCPGRGPITTAHWRPELQGNPRFLRARGFRFRPP